MEVREGYSGKTEPKKELLSLPKTLLEAAGIPGDCDLMADILPGVVLIGREEPLHRAGESLLNLLKELDIPLSEVRQALEEGGYL